MQWMYCNLRWCHVIRCRVGLCRWHLQASSSHSSSIVGKTEGQKIQNTRSVFHFIKHAAHGGHCHMLPHSQSEGNNAWWLLMLLVGHLCLTWWREKSLLLLYSCSQKRRKIKWLSMSPKSWDCCYYTFPPHQVMLDILRARLSYQ